MMHQQYRLYYVDSNANRWYLTLSRSSYKEPFSLIFSAEQACATVFNEGDSDLKEPWAINMVREPVVQYGWFIKASTKGEEDDYLYIDNVTFGASPDQIKPYPDYRQAYAALAAWFVSVNPDRKYTTFEIVEEVIDGRD